MARSNFSFANLSGGLFAALLFTTTVNAQGHLESWGGPGALQEFFDSANLPPGSDYVQIVHTGYTGLALHTGGSIEGWFDDPFGVLSSLPQGAGFTELFATSSVAAALESDGSLRLWGTDNGGVISTAPSGPGFLALALSGSSAVAIRADGSLEGWGVIDPLVDSGQLDNIPTGTGFVQIEYGSIHLIALHSDGSLHSWGSDVELGNTGHTGQVSDTPSGNDFVQIGAGRSFSVALRTDGSLVAWGWDEWSQVSDLPTGNDFVDFSVRWAGGSAMKSDGSLVRWGQGSSAEPAPYGVGYTSLYGEGNGGFAIRPDAPGQALCFGDATGSACPCSATGAAGEGCGNSTGAGAVLAGDGHASLTYDSLGFQVSGLPSSSVGLLLRGTTTANGGLGNQVGDGLLCVSGATLRSQIVSVQGGLAEFMDFKGNPFADSAGAAGEAIHYQFWYRDSANTCTGSGFNLTNAWESTWEQ